MIRNGLMLVLALGSVVAMTLILRWFFHRLSRIEQEHWAEKAGESTPRWARFLVGRKRDENGANDASAVNATERDES